MKKNNPPRNNPAYYASSSSGTPTSSEDSEAVIRQQPRPDPNVNLYPSREGTKQLRYRRGAELGWMPLPKAVPNCPPGLEYLTNTNQILVCQRIEILEILTGIETENKYMVKGASGQNMYYALEQSGFFTRYCCGPKRPFHMFILDQFGTEVIHIYRPFTCWLNRVQVYLPPNYLIGAIEERCSFCIPIFSVKNGHGENVLKIQGPYFTSSCCCHDVSFAVVSPDGKQRIGEITKQWSGLVRELFTDADYFGVTFPMDLDVTIKAVLLAAVFLIDFLFYESSDNDNKCTIC